MVLLKTNNDINKIVNLNPTFILWDYDAQVIIKKYSIYLIIIIEILFIIFILYYFFIQEIIFIYNYLFRSNLSQEDVRTLEMYSNKIKLILSSEIYCDENDNMRYNYNNNNYPALSINGDPITGCKNIIEKH
jgi:hypothetical protein